MASFCAFSQVRTPDDVVARAWPLLKRRVLDALRRCISRARLAQQAIKLFLVLPHDVEIDFRAVRAVGAARMHMHGSAIGEVRKALP